MNSFFKTFWAAFLAFLAANVIFGLFSLFFFAGMIASIGSMNHTAIANNSVMKISLEQTVTDAPPSTPFENFDFMKFKPRPSNSILQIVTAIERAAIDSRIKGIYMNVTGASIGAANAEELREALLRFKESGKFIVSYGDTYSQLEYFLCSVADKVYMNPQGGMDWRGLASQVMFYKGLLDKLGIRPEVIRHGSFKAAVEPFILDRMSDENLLQMRRMTGSVWDALVSDIAASRSVDSVLLQQYASGLEVYSPERAKQLGFVDDLLYADQVTGQINALLSAEAESKPHFVTLEGYISATMFSTAGKSKNKVEIIYADGDIVDGRSARGVVGSHTVATQLARARSDEQVKAVVLRVNSPGGSALASEVIWREMELLKAVKPVIVSMGGVAASGGYYIACPADMVLANRLTITGSIGVFGIMFDASEGMKDKLGITVDVVRTNPHADLGTPFRPMTDAERAFVQRSVEDVYTTFVGHVAAGRNMNYDAVDAIGQGRVWAGADALRIGLIDDFGGLLDAINLAADRAGIISDFSIRESTDPEDPWSAFMSALAVAKSARMHTGLGDALVHYNHIQSILSQKGVQARMPYIIDFE